MRFSSGLLSIPPLLKWRFRFVDLHSRRCPLPGFPYLILPLAVNLKRLTAALHVFFFGMSLLPLLTHGPCVV